MTAINPLNPLTFPLSGTRLIEASAGTGKTFTIAALYVRLILGHDSDNALQGRELFPPDILVVTFTEAATKELRERIRSRLSQAARYFSQLPEVGDEFLEQLRASYLPSEWPICAHRLKLAANWMDEAAIYTIHGWCNRLLQQHAFDSGSLFRQEVNNDDLELLNEVVRDYWRTFLYQMSNDDPDFQSIYLFFNQPSALLKEIQTQLRNSDQIGNCLIPNQSLKLLIAATNKFKRDKLDKLKRPWDQWADEIAALVETAVSNKVLPAKNYNVANRKNWIDKIKQWSSDPLQETLDIGKGFENLTPFGMESLAKEGHNPPKHPGFEAITQLPQQLAKLPSLRVEIIKHAIHWIRKRYDQVKQRLAQMTYDDMLTRLDKALQGDNGLRLADVIRQQYPYALFDEFQDTDPIQYRIISTLYPSRGAADLGCFMIGDPKQAIYSFRGADIFTYLKAHQATVGRHYTLGTNYRSTTALVNAINQVFLRADRQDEGAFRFKIGNGNPLPFIAVNAKGRDDEWIVNSQTAPALTVWHWETTDPIGMPDYRETMAETTASEIVRLLNRASAETGFKAQSGEVKPLQPSDIAILVRSGTEAKIMRSALASRQLRSVYLSERDSIYASLEAADLLLWLKAMAEPRNERKVRAALSTATIGWHYRTLQQLTQDELSWEQQLERFIQYQTRWQQDGILPTLRQLMDDYGLHARLTDGNEGERCLTNLLHLAELLQQASSQFEGKQALIRHLAEEIAATDQANEENVIRLESDANLIKVITIHKSKGLEYPLVFLPFICSFREANSRSPYYRYHDADQNLCIDFDKGDETKALSDKERLQEDIRLVYVAMTRAQYACWLGIAPIKSGNTRICQLEKSGMGYLLGWQSGMAANALAGQLAELKGNCDAIAITALPQISRDPYLPSERQEQRNSPRLSAAKITDHWWIASYSALQTEKTLTQYDDFYLPNEPETAHDDKHNDEADSHLSPLPKTLSGIHSLPRGAGPGILIHELLEQCGRVGFQTVWSAPEVREQLIGNVFSHSDWDGQRNIISVALMEWLAMPLLEGDDVRLCDLATDHYQAELEFLLGADNADTYTLDNLVTQHIAAGKPRPRLLQAQVNGLLKGFMDLVFVHNQKYYVADYKFNSLGDNDAAYTQEALEATLLEKRYDLQYALYLLALHRLLKARLGTDYGYDTHIGGALYLFLRGSTSPSCGRIFDKPPESLIDGLDKLFCGSLPKNPSVNGNFS